MLNLQMPEQPLNTENNSVSIEHNHAVGLPHFRFASFPRYYRLLMQLNTFNDNNDFEHTLSILLVLIRVWRSEL